MVIERRLDKAIVQLRPMCMLVMIIGAQTILVLIKTQYVGNLVILVLEDSLAGLAVHMKNMIVIHV